MDRLIHEHKSKQVRNRHKMIQRSLDAAVDTSIAVETRQWHDPDPGLMDEIRSVKDEIEKVKGRSNRRERRLYDFLLTERERLNSELIYWEFCKNKEKKRVRRVWFKNFNDPID